MLDQIAYHQQSDMKVNVELSLYYCMHHEPKQIQL